MTAPGLRILYVLMKDGDCAIPDRLLLDVRESGMEVRRQTDAGSVDPGCSYVVTDNEKGVLFARSSNTGYVFYESPGNESAPVNDAECIIQGFDEIDADFLTKMYERHRHLPWTILCTDRLKLREMTVEDVDRLYEIYKEPSITKYTEALYADRDREIEYTKAYIRNQYEFCGFGLWIAEELKGGRIVGRAGITCREGYEEAELGYIIEKDRQNRGYATEACRAIVRYADEELGMRGLNCFIQPENEISVRLCGRLGFEYLEDVELNGESFLRYHIELPGASRDN
jgi:RimJ/RimL family protein N-acetyltransferase